MKKLAAITALGLVLGFSNSSFASECMGLYTSSPSLQEATSEVRGGVVETSPMSFYLNPVSPETDSDIRTEAGDNDENALLVFGIRI
jgi:hypothetical protein